MTMGQKVEWFEDANGVPYYNVQGNTPGRMPTYALDANGNVTGLVGPGGTIPMTLGPYAFNALPSASSYSGWVVKVSNVGGSAGSYWVSNGTRWMPLNGQTMVYLLPARATMSGVTEIVLGSALLPLGLMQNTDRVDLRVTVSKSATSETATLKLRIGTAGTIADTLITSSGTLAGATISLGVVLSYRRESATSLQKLGNGNSFTNGWSGSASTAYPGPNTISSMDSSPIYLSITSQMSSTVEVAALEDFEVTLRSGA